MVEAEKLLIAAPAPGGYSMKNAGGNFFVDYNILRPQFLDYLVSRGFVLGGEEISYIGIIGRKSETEQPLSKAENERS